jgi:myosin-7
MPNAFLSLSLCLNSSQEEDLAMIAAQQYYIEYCSDLNVDRLYNLLPSYIPDYCLASTDKAVDRWGQLVVQAYKKVMYQSNRECWYCS